MNVITLERDFWHGWPSALIILRESRLLDKAKIDKDEAIAYQTGFQPTLAYLAEVSSIFNEAYAPDLIATMTPFVADSVHQAIRAQRAMDRELGNESGAETLQHLEPLLEHLSKRWSSASVYIAKQGHE